MNKEYKWRVTMYTSVPDEDDMESYDVQELHYFDTQAEAEVFMSLHESLITDNFSITLHSPDYQKAYDDISRMRLEIIRRTAQMRKDLLKDNPNGDHHL